MLISREELEQQEAARLAPSAVNRQPWRFNVETNSITVSVNTPRREYGLSKRLCCGIAMLHIEVAALSCGASGSWTFLEPPLVARFDTRQQGNKVLCPASKHTTMLI